MKRRFGKKMTGDNKSIVTDFVRINKQATAIISNCCCRVNGLFWLKRFNVAAIAVKIAIFVTLSPERDAAKCIISGNRPVATNVHLPIRTHFMMK